MRLFSLFVFFISLLSQSHDTTALSNLRHVRSSLDSRLQASSSHAQATETYADDAASVTTWTRESGTILNAAKTLVHGIEFGWTAPADQPCIYQYKCGDDIIYVGKATYCNRRTQEHNRAFRTFTANKDIYKGIKRLDSVGFGKLGTHDACMIKACGDTGKAFSVFFASVKLETLANNESFMINKHRPVCNRVVPVDQQMDGQLVFIKHLVSIAIAENAVDA